VTRRHGGFLVSAFRFSGLTTMCNLAALRYGDERL